MSNWFGISVTVFMCIGVATGLFLAINSAASLPDVYFSYPDEECVKVINYIEGHNYSCDNLPTKFYHHYVGKES